MSLKYTITQHVLLENYHAIDNVVLYLSNSPIPRYRKTSLRIRECKESFDLDSYLSGKGRKGHVACRHRLCPLCNFFSGIRMIKRIQSYIDSSGTTNKHVFLTFTLDDCYADYIGYHIEVLKDAMARFFNNKVIKQAVVGRLNYLEVAPSIHHGDKYFPHYHVILEIKSRYYSEGGVMLTEKFIYGLWDKLVERSIKKYDYPTIGRVDYKRELYNVPLLSAYGLKRIDDRLYQRKDVHEMLLGLCDYRRFSSSGSFRAGLHIH